MTKTKLKTVYKLKWKNALKLIAIILAIIVVAGIGIGIFTVLSDRANIIKVTREVEDKVQVTPIVDDEMTKTVKPDSKLSKFDAYWDYVKLSLLDVDMAALKRINSDSIGYLEIKGTDFSYPVVQGENDFYKTHSFDKSENMFGWIYLDSKANIEEQNTNTIVYGNKVWTNILSDKLMQLFKSEWSENNDNFIIKYTTSQASYLYQIISVYQTKDKSYLQTDFKDDDEIQAFIKTSISNSKIKFKASALNTDKFLTITTNSTGSNVVVLGKLIKFRE